jgi:VanZ family protein
MGLIFVISAQSDLPHHPDGAVDFIVRKMGHVVEYGVLAGLVWWAWKDETEGDSQRALIGAFILSGLYAISDEVHQCFVPGRDGQLLDVGYDLLGTVLTLAVIRGVSSLLVRREPRQYL